MWATPREYETKLSGAHLWVSENYIANKEAFDNLSDTWGWETKAKRLWADAWERRATRAHERKEGEEALLSWLTAAAEDPSNRTAALAQTGTYLSTEDYKSLLATYRLESDRIGRPIFSADGKTLLSATSSMQALQFDTSSNERWATSLKDTDSDGVQFGPPPSTNQQQTNAPSGQVFLDEPIQAAARNLIGGFARGKFHIWRAVTGKKLWMSEYIDDPPVQKGPKGGQFQYGARTTLPFISFSSDGHYFATLDWRSRVKVYYVDDQDHVVFRFSPKSAVAKLLFSPDNYSVIFVLENRTLEVHDLLTGVSRPLGVPAKLISGVGFSPDGSRFLVSIRDAVSLSRAELWDAVSLSRAEIWDTASWKLVRTIDQVAGPWASFNFCADNKTIVVSYFPNQEEKTKDLTIKFLNSETGAEEGSRTIPLDVRESYIVNPNGKSILIYAPFSGIARLRSLTPSEPAISQIQMKPPAELLEEWTKKLSLVFDHTGQLQPYRIQSP